MSENPFGRTDEIRTLSLPSCQTDNERGSIGQGHLPDDGRPTRVRRPLQAEEEENTAKETFNGTTFASFVFGCD